MMNTTVTLTTSAFERSHGHKPRGFGHWAFQRTTSRTAFERELEGELVFLTGTLTECREQLVSSGVTGLVAVLP